MDNAEQASYNNMKTVAIIPAAGAGVRMGGDRAKQFLDLDGRPLLAVTMERFQACASIDGIILVAPMMDVDYCLREIVEPYNLTKVEKVVAGGKRRQDSVRMGIEASRGDYGLVLIHDGVRPMINPDLIEKIVAFARQNPAVTAALPAKETVKEVGENGLVVKTYDRRKVWLIQTPQVFRYGDILEAHQRAVRENWEEITDDALLMEKVGITVRVIEGSEYNIKVTTPHDLELAGLLLKRERLRDTSL